jgi:hypothetical protein
MEQPTSLDIRQFQGIRRWPRYEIDLPVRILALNGVLTTPINGHGHEISRAGMALDASAGVKPGDVMQLQFPTSEPSRVVAIVRNRMGDRMGLEFLSQLPPDDETKEQTKSLSDVVPGSALGPRKLRPESCTPTTLYSGLRRKREEQQRIQKEIQALKLAIILLRDDEKDVRAVMPPPRLRVDVRPWPPQS